MKNILFIISHWDNFTITYFIDYLDRLDNFIEIDNGGDTITKEDALILKNCIEAAINKQKYHHNNVIKLGGHTMFSEHGVVYEEHAYKLLDIMNQCYPNPSKYENEKINHTIYGELYE